MSKEAMKLALAWAKASGEIVFAGGGMAAVEAMNTWVASAEKALAEQPAQKPPQNCGTGYCSCIECLFEQSVQQELVGYFSVNDYGRWEENEGEHGKPFYTEPPQRKPLTDEAIVKITSDPCLYIRGGDYRIDIARAIEAAHGIKENT